MTKQWLIDTVERVASTYVETFVALLIANWTGVLTWDIAKTAAVAAIPAALTVVKSALAGLRPGTVSPASLVVDKP